MKNKSGSEYKEVWVVFDKDIDDFFDKAIEKARTKKIKCAFSNISFEYWLLLHLIDKSGIMSFENLKSELTNLLGYKYEKNKNIERVFNDIKRKTDLAEIRAQKKHQWFISEHPSNKPSDWCSCTTVYLLIKSLKKWML